jgi:hypothetical protein
MTAVAAQVMAKNFPPLVAWIPTSLVYLLILFVAITITAVATADATPIVAKASWNDR